MNSNPKWKRFIGSILSLAVAVVIAGLSACGGSDTVASNDGGNPPPVVTPPTGGGGGSGNPPPGDGTWGFDYKIATQVTNVAEFVVKEREQSWGDSMDEFRIPVTSVRDGWSYAEGRIERNQPKYWHDGKWFIATFYGNSDGEDPRLANGGMRKNRVWINGVEDHCIVIGRPYQGDDQQAIINGAASVAHTVVNLSQGGTKVDLYEEFLSCNNGDQCPVDCKWDIPDDGFHDADKDGTGPTG